MRLSALIGLVVWLVGGLAAGGAAAAERLPVAYLGIAGDPRHAEQRSYADIVLRPAVDPFDGAKLAADSARVLGRALGIELDLQRVEVPKADDLAGAIRDLASKGTRLILLDAPGPAIAAAAAGAADAGVWLFNTSSGDDALRGAGCAANLLSVVPSDAMLADALVQDLVTLGWRRALLLVGEQPEDKATADRYAASAGKFGLEIVARRTFTESNDPRDRQQNNAALLTAGEDYDVILIADAASGFGRHLPYNTKLARPFAGSHGLKADAWHWSLERFGAPQLNRRFENKFGRRMSSADWGAWAAVKLILDGVRATRSADPDRIVAAIRSPDFVFDAYKGLPASFRDWDNQLRQPVLLHTADAVVGIAPTKGFIHPGTDLDTVGKDRAESACTAVAAGATQ